MNIQLNISQKYIIDHNYTSYLEIGTAYGYSAAQIERNENVNRIVSVEKNEHNYKIAKNFFVQIYENNFN